MDIKSFVNAYLGEHRYSKGGREIQVAICPFCQNDQKGNTYKFSINSETGLYKCWRSSCQVKGHITELYKKFGVEVPSQYAPTYIKTGIKKQYQKPKITPQKTTDKIEQYFIKRKISKATYEKFGIGSDGKGNILIPFFRDGKHVFSKYRVPEKYKKGESKFPKEWRDEDTEAIFWNMDGCEHSESLIITEGMMDALALAECGFNNVTSVPSGTKDLECINTCWDWLEKFKHIILWTDADNEGRELEETLIKRFGEWRCLKVRTNRKDANDILCFDGKDAISKAINSAKEVEFAGIIQVSEIKDIDYSAIEKVGSSIQKINKYLGGFMMGDVTVWTGVNGSAKSTFLGCEMLSAMTEEKGVCIFSGELSQARFKRWMDLQAAGMNNTKTYIDPIKKEHVPFVPWEIKEKINRWYHNKFFLFDKRKLKSTDKDLFRVFEYAAMRYNCKVFVVDNLMKIRFTGEESEFYRQQSVFVDDLKNFADKFDAHVHLVAHPRKTNGRLKKMDVMGSGDITNLADNVLSIHRLTDKEKIQHEDADNLIDIFKSREHGSQDVEILLKFEPFSKRLYEINASVEDGAQRKFGWEL